MLPGSTGVRSLIGGWKLQCMEAEGCQVPLSVILKSALQISCGLREPEPQPC